MKILVTGGAGYIGCVLVQELLNIGHEVIVYDNLRFGGIGLLGMFRYPKFSLLKADIRDSVLLKKAVTKTDVVVHLASIVGYPACKKEAQLATEVNVEATRLLVNMLAKEQFVLFGSTCSNYGAAVDVICTEEEPLNPVSLYGKTKTEAEKIIMNDCTATTYRFPTAFGLSPRLRLDLLINHFVYKALTDKYIVVYESHFLRSFIHVYDIVRSFVFGIENRDSMAGEVYNVGDESMNFSKKRICELIAKEINYYYYLAEIGKDIDVRNYFVSYNKIKALGYHTTIDMEIGIKELTSGIQAIKIVNPYSNADEF
ncbi:MAG: NAD(P)-dependent oxidoreductase [Desulfobacteraceae bacterium]|nr:NAD(P)-dependent oxidoreductase [Desulfobacteraceae bacterium]MBC2755234.1 NAD(P)-dependent oxidoreductase [Desulfobacteraceae bacterium]